jgi:hypothetical protein
MLDGETCILRSANGNIGFPFPGIGYGVEHPQLMRFVFEHKSIPALMLCYDTPGTNSWYSSVISVVSRRHEGGRGLAEFFLETLREIRLVIETDLVGYLRNGIGPLFNELRRSS